MLGSSGSVYGFKGRVKLSPREERSTEGPAHLPTAHSPAGPPASPAAGGFSASAASAAPPASSGLFSTPPGGASASAQRPRTCGDGALEKARQPAPGSAAPFLLRQPVLSLIRTTSDLPNEQINTHGGHGSVSISRHLVCTARQRCSKDRVVTSRSRVEGWRKLRGCGGCPQTPC